MRNELNNSMSYVLLTFLRDEVMWTARFEQVFCIMCDTRTIDGVNETVVICYSAGKMDEFF